MFRRLLLMFSVLLLFSFNFAYAECFFDSFSQECPRFSTPYNEFNVDFSPESNLESFTASIYNKDNPSNKILTETDANTIRNLNPFVEPGVYVLEIKSQTRAGVIDYQSAEYIFDNTVPAPPIVPMNLQTNVDSIVIRGQAQPTSVVNIEGVGIALSASVDSSGNFEQAVSLSSSGWNKLSFTTNVNGRESQEVVRSVYYGTNLVQSLAGSVSSVSFADAVANNPRTYLDGKYYTSQRNFYVGGTLSGSDLKGTPVFVNGIKVLSDSSGNFGAVVILNEGDNRIEVEADGKTGSINVFYTVPRFQFLGVDYDKVSASNSLAVDVELNYQLPFNVYLNGQLVSVQEPSSSTHSFTVPNLVSGKNYVFFEGLNGEFFYDLVYVDSATPTVELVSFSKFANSNELVFKIRDDLSVDLNSFLLNIGPYTFPGSKVDVFGDFFVVDIVEVPDGSYNFDVSVKDMVGNEATLANTLDIDTTNTIIDRFRITRGSVVGDTIHVMSGEQAFTMIPSRYIAFDKIYLDGQEQVDYEIKLNGNVEISIDFQEAQGTLELNFVNNEGEYVTQTFNYYTDMEQPQVELDYVLRPYSSGEYVLISGEITDSLFNWASLEFNSEQKYSRFGDYFEAYVKADDIGVDNLIVVGQDFSGNTFEENIFGSLLYLDESSSSISFNTPAKSKVSGTFTGETDLMQFATSYDGFDSQRIFLADNFDIGAAQREGLRSVNLKGVESSYREVRNINAITVDDSVPMIYFVSGSDLKIIIDGTLSPVDLGTLEVLVDTVPVNIIDTCSSYQKVGFYDTCREISVGNGQEVSVTVLDTAGNEGKALFNFGVDNFDSLQTPSTAMEIYFSGNDYLTSEENYFVQGQVRTSAPLSSVSVDSGSCSFDDFNFVCFTTLDPGVNNVEITAENVNSESTSDSYEIEYVVPDLDVSITDVQSSVLYNVNGIYYTLVPELDVLGEVNKNVLINLIVDGRTTPQGEKLSSFTIPVDLTIETAGKNTDEFEIELQAEDELGNKAFSEQVLIVFNRIAETVVEIVIS